MATVPQICGFLLLPERTDALNAIARTIGKIRQRHGQKPADIARALKKPDGKAPDEDTIARAERGENLLSFDLVAQLATIYHDCAEPIRALLMPVGAIEPTTVEDRLQRAEQEILAVRRELANREGAA